MSVDLDSYNTVAERIVEFLEKYPTGSLQRVGELQFVSYAGADWVIYTAAAYRTPDDLRPGYGTAWERVPGTTNFTKGSEIQNAETSAWGRAIIAIGAADTRKGITSSDEVKLAIARQEALPPREWVKEAEKKSTADEVLSVWREAKTKGAAVAVLDQIAALGLQRRQMEEAATANPATGEVIDPAAPTDPNWNVTAIGTPAPEGGDAA